LIQRFGADQVHQADLTEEGAAQQVVQAVLAREGQLDGVVHAMGEFFSGAPSETGRDQIQSLWRSNMLSAADLLDGARAALRESGGAAVFFGTAGLDGLRGRETTAAYTAAKTALLVWMKSAALEEAPHGVRINMVSPGIIPHMGAAPETQDPERIARIPSGRGGKPEEVAAAVNWLLSPDASYVIGQNLEVAGGWLL
jgi:3-oxoacyl-[acyl-carrier protein] reductase